MKVNLLLKRASQWLDLLSYEGWVDFRIKAPLQHLQVRMPEWVKPEEVSGTVDDRSCNLRVNGRYVDFGAVQPGQVVVMRFPISERTENLVIN
jgi:hypothetical protein